MARGGLVGTRDFPNKGGGLFVSWLSTQAPGFMRHLIIMLMLMAVALANATRAAAQATTYYVQLIRGTTSEQPPAPKSKCVGRKLEQTFGPVFSCKAYWEVNRHQVALSSGQVARVQLGNGREAEIDLRSPKARKVAAFLNGQLVDRTVIPKGEGMTIIGGKREDKGVWFIVVRRDKPAD